MEYSKIVYRAGIYIWRRVRYNMVNNGQEVRRHLFLHEGSVFYAQKAI